MRKLLIFLFLLSATTLLAQKKQILSRSYYRVAMSCEVYEDSSYESRRLQDIREGEIISIFGKYNKEAELVGVEHGGYKVYLKSPMLQYMYKNRFVGEANKPVVYKNILDYPSFYSQNGQPQRSISTRPASPNDPCKVNKKVDKFTGAITYTVDPSLVISFNSAVIQFVKNVSEQDTVIGMAISNSARNVPSLENRRGVYFLFEDGSKIAKPDAEVDYSVSSSYSYNTKAIVILSDEDIDFFMTKRLTDVRVGRSDSEVNLRQAEKIRTAINCLGTYW